MKRRRPPEPRAQLAAAQRARGIELAGEPVVRRFRRAPKLQVGAGIRGGDPGAAAKVQHERASGSRRTNAHAAPAGEPVDRAARRRRQARPAADRRAAPSTSAASRNRGWPRSARSACSTSLRERDRRHRPQPAQAHVGERVAAGRVARQAGRVVARRRAAPRDFAAPRPPRRRARGAPATPRPPGRAPAAPGPSASRPLTASDAAADRRPHRQRLVALADRREPIAGLDRARRARPAPSAGRSPSSDANARVMPRRPPRPARSRPTDARRARSRARASRSPRRATAGIPGERTPPRRDRAPARHPQVVGQRRPVPPRLEAQHVRRDQRHVVALGRARQPVRQARRRARGEASATIARSAGRGSPCGGPPCRPRPRSRRRPGRRGSPAAGPTGRCSA